MTSRTLRTRIGLLLLVFLLLAIYSEFDLTIQRPHPWAADFAGSYADAVDAARQGESPYLPFVVGESFFYHPFALTVFGLVLVPGAGVGSLLWAAINVAAYGLTIAVLLRLPGRARLPRWQRTLAVGLAVSFAPLWFSIHMGQVNAVVTCALALVLWLSLAERQTAAGLALALAVTLKITPLLFVAYFLIMGQFTAVIALVVGLVGLTVVPVIQFGPGVLADFVAFVPLAGGELFRSSYNRSPTMVAIRLLDAVHLRPPDGVLVWAQRVIAGGLALAALGMSWRRRAQSGGQAWLFGALVVVMVIVAPLVWYHHNTFLIIPLLVALTARDRRLMWEAVGAALLIQANLLLEFVSVLALRDPVLSGLPALIGQGWLVMLMLRGLAQSADIED